MDWEEEVRKVVEEMGYSEEMLKGISGDKYDSAWEELVKQFKVNASRTYCRNEKYRRQYEELAYNVAVFYTKLYVEDIVRVAKIGGSQ